jgi:hypothetical protein
MMMELIASICLLALVVGLSSDRFRKYHAIEAYEIGPGFMLTPTYAASHDLCEIGIEKRRYSGNGVDMDAAMTKEQILSLFDELIPKEERGGPSRGLPADTEISEVDLGMVSTRVPYENVTLTMYGKKDRPDRQKYIAATISWNKPSCNAGGRVAHP